jgi:hypothetical protein
MTLNRLLTTLVQLGIGIPALIILKLIIQDLKENRLN